MKLTPDDVSRVCRLVDEVAGIQWDASKTYLIENRLGTLLKEFQCADTGELVARIRSGKEPTLKARFVDAVTTRETLFFRDESTFEALRHKALPEIIDAKERTPFSRRLRLWSAACSSGQEPYSLAMLLRELIDDIDSWDVQILATDLSPAALATASCGVYSDFDLSRGLPPVLRDKYFRKTPEGWKISESVRKLVRFETCNLLEPFRNPGPFDVIFCRNVAIYFSLPVKRELFERLSQTLCRGGAIFIGASESLLGFGERWTPRAHCRGVFYQPNQHGNASENPATLPPVRTLRPPLLSKAKN